MDTLTNEFIEILAWGAGEVAPAEVVHNEPVGETAGAEPPLERAAVPAGGPAATASRSRRGPGWCNRADRYGRLPPARPVSATKRYLPVATATLSPTGTRWGTTVLSALDTLFSLGRVVRFPAAGCLMGADERGIPLTCAVLASLVLAARR